MVEEMESLKKNETWDLVQLSQGKRAIGCKWTYKKKSTVTEKEREKFMARLVAKGIHSRRGLIMLIFSVRWLDTLLLGQY